MSDVAQIDANASIHDAATKMANCNVGSLVIVDVQGTPRGILTDRDIVTAVVAPGLNIEETVVGEVMARPVVSVRETAGIGMALSCMTLGMRRVPVVDERERLVGIVSLDDILLMHSKEFDRVRKILEKELHLPA